MRSAVAVLLLAASALCRAQSRDALRLGEVPFVGCASDGQVGPKAPPFGTTKLVWATPWEAAQLAYYRAGDLAVLAPRGWHCFELYDSSGSGLHVAPAPFEGGRFLDDARAGLRGPAVETQWRCGGTSGRFTVAEFIAMVFPSRLGFTLEVMQAFEMVPSRFRFGPYPEDRLVYRTPDSLRYTTPAWKQGLGTRSWLKPGARPIEEAALLTGEFPDLLHLAIRLPDNLASLSPAIIRQFEADAAQQQH